MDEKLKEYRNHLVIAEQKAQEDYDKTVIALSGGALGISFAFVEQFVDPGHIQDFILLVWAWAAWAASLGCVLVTFYTSHLALKRAIKSVDNGTVYDQHPGGFGDSVTRFLNAAGGILFVIGLTLMLWFVSSNIKG